MQIRINLHPQRGTRQRSSASFAPSAGFARVLAPFRDKFLMGAIAAVLVAFATVGSLYTQQDAERAELVDREQQAVADSTKFATAIAARAKATSRRDSLSRQLRVIAAIDSNRYLWAHLLDETSRALPTYTWLVGVQQTSAAPSPPGQTPKPGAKPAPNATPAKLIPDTVVGPVRFRIVGHTVDLQALTLYMRDLEASPFIRNVQLAKSEPSNGEGKDVTEFTLEAEAERAPKSMMRTVSITVPLR
jgi:Tfp pilus assembly protein PilN